MHRWSWVRPALVLGAALAAACGGSSPSASSPSAPTPASSSPSADVLITIRGIDGGMSFSPPDATARVGQTVAWRNADSVVHDVAQDGGGFETGSVGAGATSRSVTVSNAGAFPYHCTIHPTMVGTLTVNP